MHMQADARRAICQAAACLLSSSFTAPALFARRASATTSPLSSALERAEYSNSIIASRDTNVSPREVYDTIRDKCRPPDGATRESMASYAELRADYYFR